MVGAWRQIYGGMWCRGSGIIGGFSSEITFLVIFTWKLVFGNVIHTLAHTRSRNGAHRQWIKSIRNVRNAEPPIAAQYEPGQIMVVLSGVCACFAICQTQCTVKIPCTNTEKLIGLKHANRINCRLKGELCQPNGMEWCTHFGFISVTSKQWAQSKTHEMEKRFRY